VRYLLNGRKAGVTKGKQRGGRRVEAEKKKKKTRGLQGEDLGGRLKKGGRPKTNKRKSKQKCV